MTEDVDRGKQSRCVMPGQEPEPPKTDAHTHPTRDAKELQDKTAKAKHEYQSRIFRPSSKNKETNKSNNSTDKKTKTHRSGSKNKENQESSEVLQGKHKAHESEYEEIKSNQLENKFNDQRSLPQQTDQSLPISITDQPDKDNTERELNKNVTIENEENKTAKDKSKEKKTHKKSYSSSRKYSKRDEKNCKEKANATETSDNKDSSDNKPKESFKNENNKIPESKQLGEKTDSPLTNGSVEPKDEKHLSARNRKTRNPFSQKVEYLKDSEIGNKSDQLIKPMAENNDSINDNKKREVSCNRSNNGNPFKHRTYERSHDKRDGSLSKNKEKPLDSKESRDCSEDKNKESDRTIKEETRNRRNPFSQHPESDRNSSVKRSLSKEKPLESKECRDCSEDKSKESDRTIKEKTTNKRNPFSQHPESDRNSSGKRSLSKEKPLEFKESRECSEDKSKESDLTIKEETRNKRNPFSQHPESDRNSSGKLSNEKQTAPQIVEYNLFLGNKNNKKNYKETFLPSGGKGTNIDKKQIFSEQCETITGTSEANSKDDQENNTTYSVNKIESTSKSDCKTNITSQQTKANRNPFACKPKQSFGQALEENKNQRIGETFKKDITPQQQHSNNIENLDKENKPNNEPVSQSKERKKTNYGTKTSSRQRNNSRYHKRGENKNLEKPTTQETSEKKDPKTDKYANFLSTPKVLEEERMFYKRLSIDDISKLDKPGNLNLPHLAHREKVETLPIKDQQPNANNTLSNQCDSVETSKVEEENKSKFVIPKLGRKYQDTNTSWQRHKSYPRQSQKFDTPLLKLERTMEQSNRELQLQREQEAKAKRNPLLNTSNPESINKPIENIICHELENVKNLKTGPTKPNVFDTPKSQGGPQQEKEKEKVQISKDLAKTANVLQINRSSKDMQEKERNISKETEINVVSKLPEIQNNIEKSQNDDNKNKLANNKQQAKTHNLKKNNENMSIKDSKPLKESCEEKQYYSSEKKVDVEKNQKEETVKTSNKPIKEAPKNPKINEKCSNTASSLGEQKSEEKESFKKQTENLKEGLIKLKKLQREDTNDKEIMKNQEQDKNHKALEEKKKEMNEEDKETSSAVGKEDCDTFGDDLEMLEDMIKRKNEELRQLDIQEKNINECKAESSEEPRENVKKLGSKEKQKLGKSIKSGNQEKVDSELKDDDIEELEAAIKRRSEELKGIEEALEKKEEADQIKKIKQIISKSNEKNIRHIIEELDQFAREKEKKSSNSTKSDDSQTSKDSTDSEDPSPDKRPNRQYFTVNRNYVQRETIVRNNIGIVRADEMHCPDNRMALYELPNPDPRLQNALAYHQQFPSITHSQIVLRSRPPQPNPYTWVPMRPLPVQPNICDRNRFLNVNPMNKPMPVYGFVQFKNAEMMPHQYIQFPQQITHTQCDAFPQQNPDLNIVQPFPNESFFNRKKIQPFSIGSHFRKVEESIQRRKDELKRFLRDKEKPQTHHKISLADACRQIQSANHPTKQPETIIKKISKPNEQKPEQTEKVREPIAQQVHVTNKSSEEHKSTNDEPKPTEIDKEEKPGNGISNSCPTSVHDKPQNVSAEETSEQNKHGKNVEKPPEDLWNENKKPIELEMKIESDNINVNNDSLEEKQENIQDCESDTTRHCEKLLTDHKQSQYIDKALSINMKDTEILMNANCENENKIQLNKNNAEDVKEKENIFHRKKLKQCATFNESRELKIPEEHPIVDNKEVIISELLNELETGIDNDAKNDILNNLLMDNTVANSLNTKIEDLSENNTEEKVMSNKSVVSNDRSKQFQLPIPLNSQQLGDPYNSTQPTQEKIIQEEPYFDATMFSNLTELQVFPIDNDFKGHTEESLTKENIMQENVIIQNKIPISNCAKEHTNTYQRSTAKPNNFSVCQQGTAVPEIQKPMNKLFQLKEIQVFPIAAEDVQNITMKSSNLEIKPELKKELMDLKQLSDEASNEVNTEETLKALEDLPTKIRVEAKEKDNVAIVIPVQKITDFHPEKVSGFVKCCNDSVEELKDESMTIKLQTPEKAPAEKREVLHYHPITVTPEQKETDFNAQLFLNRRDIQVFRLCNDNEGCEPICQPKNDALTQEINDNEEKIFNNLEVTSMAKVKKIQKGTSIAQRIKKCESVPNHAVVQQKLIQCHPPAVNPVLQNTNLTSVPFINQTGIPKFPVNQEINQLNQVNVGSKKPKHNNAMKANDVKMTSAKPCQSQQLMVNGPQTGKPVTVPKKCIRKVQKKRLKPEKTSIDPEKKFFSEQSETQFPIPGSMVPMNKLDVTSKRAPNAPQERVLAKEKVSQTNVGFEKDHNNKESENEICKTGLMFDERSKIVQNPMADGLPIENTNSIPTNIGSLGGLSPNISTQAEPIVLMPLAELLAQIQQNSSQKLASPVKKVPPLKIRQQKKGLKRLTNNTVKNPKRSIEQDGKQFQKPTVASSSIKRPATLPEKLNQNADASSNFTRKPIQRRPINQVPQNRNFIQGTPNKPNEICQNTMSYNEYKGETEVQNQFANNVVSNQMGAAISKDTQIKQTPLIANRKRISSISVGKDIRNLEEANQQSVNEYKEIFGWNGQTDQIIKPQQNLPTDNTNALLLQKKPIQCSLNTSNPIQQAPLQAPTMPNQVKARSCSIGKDLNMFGEQKQFGKPENLTKNENLVQENQIVQPKEAERQPLKICIDLKKNSTSIEMDRKQKKKEEKKKAKEEKKRKRKKERDVKRLLKKWKKKDTKPLANENAAAPVKCNETPQKPIQPIAQKKIRLREVSSTSQENTPRNPNIMRQQVSRPFSRGKDLSRLEESLQPQKEAETKVVLNEKSRDMEMSMSDRQEPIKMSKINAAPCKMKPIDNDVAKQNDINKIVQFLEGGSKEVESNVQLKKTESNKELINKKQSQIPMQMGTTGVNNMVNNKRPNMNPPSFNQPIKKMKLAQNTNPNSKPEETVPRKQPTTNTEIPKEEEHMNKKVVTTLTKENEFKGQSTIEKKVVEDLQNKNIMMKIATMNTKKDIPNSAENANPTITNAISGLNKVPQVTKENSSVEVNKETGFSDAFKALGFKGQVENKAEPVTATSVAKVKDINKNATEPEQKTINSSKVNEIKPNEEEPREEADRKRREDKRQLEYENISSRPIEEHGSEYPEIDIDEALQSRIRMKNMMKGQLKLPMQTQLTEMLPHLPDEDAVDLEEVGVLDTFQTYTPKLSINNSMFEHPNKVLELASLCSVQLPEVDRQMPLTEKYKYANRLSNVQLEVLSYVSQAHEQILGSGQRAGFLLGDGPGMGKGRVLAAFIYENFKQGRKRALWVSMSEEMKVNIERDLNAVGANGQIKVAPLSSFQYDDIVTDNECVSFEKGIVCCSYTELSTESPDPDSTNSNHVMQLMEWLGNCGVIVFDECHKANAMSLTNTNKFIGLCTMVLQLQEQLPLARVVYASATGAAEPRNMVYMPRLGLWGEGAAWSQFQEFVNAMEKRGSGAMDCIGADMKLRGIYLARHLTYENVQFRIEVVPITRDIIKFYNYSTDVWGKLYEQTKKACRRLCINSRAEEMIIRKYWSAHTRFFKNLCLSAKTKQMAVLANEALSKQQAVVIGLHATGECRALDYLKDSNIELNEPDSFVSTSKSIIQSYMDNYFPSPTQEYFDKLSNANAFYQEPSNGIKRARMDWDEGESEKDNYEEELDEEDNPNIPIFGRKRRHPPTKKVKKSPRQRILRNFCNIKHPENENEDFRINFDTFDPMQAKITKAEVMRCMSARGKFVDKIQQIAHRMPPNALDKLISELGGSQQVAEITMRRSRVLKTQDDTYHYQMRAQTDAGLDQLNYREIQSFLSGSKQVALITEAATCGVSLVQGDAAGNQRKVQHFTMELPWSTDRALQQLGRTKRTNQQNAPQYTLVVSNLVSEIYMANMVAAQLKRLGAVDCGEVQQDEEVLFNLHTSLGHSALDSVLQQISGKKPMEMDLVPKSIDGNFQSQACEALCNVAILALDPNDADQKTYLIECSNVTIFLNRILGCVLEIQNAIFRFFLNNVRSLILQNRRTGQVDLGVLDLDVHGRVSGIPKHINFRRKTALGNSYVELRTIIIERGMTFEEAMAEYGKRERQDYEGFYVLTQPLNGIKCAILCLIPDGIEVPTGDCLQLRICRPNIGFQKRTESLQSIRGRYSKTLPKEAEQLWLDQFNRSLSSCAHLYWNNKDNSYGMRCNYAKNCSLGLRMRSYHVLSGLIERIWERVAQIIEKTGRHLQIARVSLEPNHKVVGILIPESAYRRIVADLSRDSIIESRD